MNRLISIALVCLLQVSLTVASSFNLRVEVTPNGAGSLNTSGGTYEEGSNINLRTNANTGYVFKGWYEGETLLSSATSFSYTMPSNDAMVQARYEFDPSVPGNPAMPDTTTYYTLTATVSPVGAGTLNTYSGRYAAGATVNMRTYGNTGYQFVGWQNEGGETVSISSSFNYTMPRGDSQLTALYVYDPSVPANPDSMATQYTVTLACKPVGGGTFNTTSATVEEGGNVHLYAYTNTGYRFLCWENESGKTVSTAQEFYYIMPHGGSKLYGIFEYDPAVPGNPSKNYWNKNLGEVIVDDFTPGSLGSSVSSVINGSNRNDVAMITVAGRMNDNDFGIANDYTNCTLLDLSRVTGIIQVPSYAFDYTNLESVYLPATIEKIGYRAFYECKHLSSLFVYAMTPPVLENEVFKGVADGLVVYVPSTAVTQYQDADGWKDFTILPIQEDIRSLSISLPIGAKVADYANMWLELTNTKSGQKLHYVMTDRQIYTFTNIIHNTSWNVTLRNERGDEFGRIDNVNVKDEDVSVAFSSLSTPQNITLSAKTPDGKNVTEQTQITWTDTQGNYVAQGASLTGLPVGYQVNYRLALSQELAMAYNTPTEVAYTLKDGGNDITLQLSPITQITLSGKVKDATTGLPLSDAIVSASQTFGGKYSKTLNVKTDNKGEYTLTVADVPTSLGIAATDYISQTITFDNGLSGVNGLDDVSLKPITGATITVNLTYTTVEGETQSWYSDYQNVGYTLYNVTKNRVISQYNVQYPQIVLLEDVDDGDVLRLTATSHTNAFMPVESTATIAEQRAEATFTITELGQIHATFTNTGNTSVVGSLYDASGKLAKTYDYSNAQLTISDLADGQYTLVSMGSSRLFNTIYDLAQLPHTGLTEGTDYVRNTVAVSSGAISQISIAEVPTLDESKLYYTGDNTSFTVNKPSIVVGNYLTLTGHVDFKPAYANNVSNVQMIVDLPESCEFVENSVMVGNSTSSYTLNGNQITIPMNRYTDRVRFCIIPTLGGDNAPSAFAQFDLGGKTITQPIGSANYTAKDLSISVPSTVAKTSVPVSGTAIGQSSVEIYDNGVLIGQTTSLANGTWATMCELNEPYNLSRHQLFAKVTTKQGIELVSENVSCVYDMNAIQVSTVKMYHENPELRRTYELTFDFLNPSNKEENYIYYIYNKKFTFTIDFTDNDTTKVSDVVLYVKTAKSGWHPLYANYDVKLKKWIAAGHFGNMYDGDLPINVSVDYKHNSVVAADFEQTNDFFYTDEEINEIRERYQKINRIIKEFLEQPRQFDNLMCLIEESISPEDLVEVKMFEDSIADLDDAQIDSLMDKYFSTNYSSEFEQLAGDISFDKYYEFSSGDFTYKYCTCDGIRKEKLTDFLKINTVYNDTVYVLNTNDRICYVDFRRDIYFDILKHTSNKTMLRAEKTETEALWDWESFLLDEKIFKKLLADKEAETIKYLKDLRKELGVIKRCKNETKILEHLDKAVTAGKNYQGALKAVPKLAKLGKMAKGAPIVDLAINGYQFYDKYNEVSQIIGSPTGCTSAEHLALQKAYEKRASDMKRNAGIYHTSNFALGTGAGALIAMVGVACPWSLLITVPAAFAINYAADTWFDNKFEREAQDLRQSYEMLTKRCKGDSPDLINRGIESGNPDKKFGIDPSGYIYEGVMTNRVRGATATIYYKEYVEDMFGDLHENIVSWDAEEYAQKNPLFTDENGFYRWDVPQGLWQVKFEKEGYETTYSEWLPVPPPQLDVNIAMKQNVQPTVKLAHAFEDAVEVEFDKYMMPELLTTDNIIVMQGNEAVSGSVELLNNEASYEGSSETFASKIRFNATQPFAEQEVTLIVNNHVKSYAGIRMQDDYQQTFTIEQEIKHIVSDSLTVVDYGGEAILTVSVLPASASKGKILNVKTSSPMILGVETEHVMIGNDGKAEVTLSGELPGIAALTFSIEGTDKTAITIASVEQKANETVAAPTANIASGTVIDKGTQIVLSSTIEGAVIYYTLDGSCPCDNTAGRNLYDTPIVINENTTIKAIIVTPDMTESDVVEFTYYVNGTAIDDVSIDDLIDIYPLPVRDKLNVTAGGKMIKSVIISTMNGVVVESTAKTTTKVTLDVSKIPIGIYIVNVATEDGSYSRKVLKVQ